MAKKRTKARAKFTDQIRLAVEGCGETRYRISLETGIDQSTMSRFVKGERGLSFEALDALGEYLGLEVIAHGRKRP